MNTSGLLSFQGPHAETALSILRRRRALADLSDTGVGKTAVAIALCRELKVVPLVVGPLGVKASWEAMAERLEWQVCFVNYERARGHRTRDLEGQKQRNSVSDWGHEQAWGKGSYWRWDKVVDTIIFDEVHWCGGTSTLNSKMLIAAKRQLGNVICLSATAAESPTQLKALGYVLGLHDLKKFQDFLFAYGCVPDIWGGRPVFSDDPQVREKALRKLHAALYPHRAVRLRKADVPGFPKCDTHILPLDDEEGAVHIADRLHTRTKEAGPVPAADRDVTALRMDLESRRAPQVVSLVEDAVQDAKVVVFVNFLDSAFDLEGCFRRRGLRTGLLTGERICLGDTQYVDNTEVVAAFQRNEVDVLVCTYGAGGTGISLHDPTGKVERVSYLYPTWSVKQLCQGVGRVHRAEGAFSRQFFLYFKGTYEEEVAELTLRNLDGLSLLNDGQLSGLFASRGV